MQIGPEWPISDAIAREPGKMHYRTIFLSDIHPGTRGCQAERLLDFLEHHICDRLYLVGDIVDGGRMKSATTTAGSRAGATSATPCCWS